MKIWIFWPLKIWITHDSWGVEISTGLEISIWCWKSVKDIKIYFRIHLPSITRRSLFGNLIFVNFDWKAKIALCFWSVVFVVFWVPHVDKMLLIVLPKKFATFYIFMFFHISYSSKVIRDWSSKALLVLTFVWHFHVCLASSPIYNFESVAFFGCFDDF